MPASALLSQSSTRWHRWLVASVWIAFVVKGVFYITFLPVWEGFDEWAHYAVIRHVSLTGAFPTRDAIIPPEIEQSFSVIPLPRSFESGGPLFAHDEYWQLPPVERSLLQRQFRELSSNRIDGTMRTKSYEAQQPPLYYFGLAQLDRMLTNEPLGVRVWSIRLIGILLVSICIPVCFITAARIVKNVWVCLVITAALAAYPGLMTSAAHVTNDCLAIPLIALIIFLSISEQVSWAGVGVTLGCALLTKAYSVALLPLPVFMVLTQVAKGRSPRWCSVLACYAITTVMAGWWYAQTWMHTGSVTGEQLESAALGSVGVGMLKQVGKVDWRSAVDSITFTHIWCGNWSFLQVRSWMYHVIRFAAAVALVGCAFLCCRQIGPSLFKRKLVHEHGAIIIMIASCCLFYIALAYHVVVVFSVTGKSTSLGWYLNGVLIPELILMAVGFRYLFASLALRILSAVAVGFAALGGYTENWVLMPYYTGRIFFRQNGMLANFAPNWTWNEWAEMFGRLTVNKAEWVTTDVVFLLWLLSIMSTIFLLILPLSIGMMSVRQKSVESVVT